MENRLSSLRRSVLLCLMLYALFNFKSFGQTFPASFSRVQVANGISSPTSMAFAPDGRVFVCQQGGKVIVIKNGVKLATSAISLSVDPNGERGLIGIAVDPNFATNNYVYLYYTVPAGSERSAAFNRISRFTFSGDVIDTSSKLNILSLNDLSGATNHNGGSLNFGLDGKLYIGVGENANGSYAQNLDNYLGKLLRVNPDGSVPAGNPFTGNAARSRIWAYGLRNPFTFNVDPSSGKIYVNDVGQDSWEEINDATTGGKNFGWPNAEGNCSGCGYSNPAYYYGRVYDNGTDGKGCSINGGTFLASSANNYPAKYKGKYFFTDYCGDWINYIDPANPSVRNSFAAFIGGGVVYLIAGNDGNLYYLSRDNGTLYKVVYNGNTAPAIASQPADASIEKGKTATFSVSASGSPAPTYQWRKNGANISGATSSVYTIASVTDADAGQYSVVVSNTAGSVTSRNAILTVTAPNIPPVANIVSPVTNSKYRAGDIISYSGTGTDSEDGTLPASAFNWEVIFHHDEHTHPGPNASDGVKSGTFQTDKLGETSANVWYELKLTVTDTRGDIGTKSVFIYPVTSTLYIATVPAGLLLKLDDQPKASPINVKAVSGMTRKIDVVSPQTFNGSTYVFDRWAHGGAAAQSITITDDSTAYIAYFIISPNQVPTATITSPANGSVYSAPANVNITATATDADGTISKVEFFQGAIKLGEDLTSPYAFSWTSVLSGTYSLTVKSTDDKGAITTSSEIKITVNESSNTNLALNKPVSVSSIEGAGFESVKAVDGSASTRWASAEGIDPQWIYVDLGATYSINRIKITWEAAYGKDYQVQISSNASAWTSLKSVTGNTTLVNDHTGLSGSGRYVRINGTARGTAYGYSIFELEVYGTSGTPNQAPAVSITSPANGSSFTAPASVPINASASDADGTIAKVEFFNGSTKLGEDTSSPYSFSWSSVAAGTYTLTAKATDDKGAVTTSSSVSITVSGATNNNLALNKPTTVSSIEVAGFEGAKAVDASAATRWASLEGVDPQWIYVDLGATFSINRVKITWEAAYGKDYQVQISSNASTWTALKTVTGNTTLVNDHTGLSGSGRYVRINGTARGTTYGYSIFELEVYGTATTARTEPEQSEVIAKESIISFPNPVADRVTLQVPSNLQKRGKIEVLNRQGRTFLSENVKSAEHTLDISTIPAGLYFIHISNRTDSQVHKIIKK